MIIADKRSLQITQSWFKYIITGGFVRDFDIFKMCSRADH